MRTDYVDTNQPSPMAYMVQAINHFVSTGDAFGQAMVLDAGRDNWQVVIAYAMGDAVDSDDFHRFESRLTEVRGQTRLPLRLDHIGVANGHQTYVLHVSGRDMLRVAQELLREPGRAGWGSMYSNIQHHFPHLREEIQSAQEGM